jgi:hypothetical protein
LHIKNIPNNKRSKVNNKLINKKLWLLTSGAKREMNYCPLYYKYLTDEFPNSVPSPYKDQIQMVYNFLICRISKELSLMTPFFIRRKP